LPVTLNTVIALGRYFLAPSALQLLQLHVVYIGVCRTSFFSQGSIIMRPHCSLPENLIFLR